MARFEDLKYGDKVIVRARGGYTRHGIISDLDEEGKNGQPTVGFTLTQDCGGGADFKGDDCWCYADQVTSFTR